VRQIDYKNSIAISAEWDSICETRQKAIEQGKDVSLLSVTGPCILRNLKKHIPDRLIDIGCGTGYLTYKLSEIANNCIGIDISTKSIQVAQAHYKRQNLKFDCCAIEEVSDFDSYDACVSNMVFTSTPNWLDVLSHVRNLLTIDGRIYFTIPHPCFWPQYWEYLNEPWFNYAQETFIEHDFRTSLSTSMGTTTHIHRPLSQYINGILSSGFIIEKVEEPFPTTPIPPEYHYDYPRFLFFQCKKI
jgi:methyltransferase type 11